MNFPNWRSDYCSKSVWKTQSSREKERKWEGSRRYSDALSTVIEAKAFVSFRKLAIPHAEERRAQKRRIPIQNFNGPMCACGMMSHRHCDCVDAEENWESGSELHAAEAEKYACAIARWVNVLKSSQTKRLHNLELIYSEGNQYNNKSAIKSLIAKLFTRRYTPLF